MDKKNIVEIILLISWIIIWAIAWSNCIGTIDFEHLGAMFGWLWCLTFIGNGLSKIFETNKKDEVKK